MTDNDQIVPQDKNPVNYSVRPMVNEYGSIYGHTYYVKSEADADRLIAEVIGEDAYYGSRDVWSQIDIVVTTDAADDAARNGGAR